jgi:hypothetical protein
MAREKEMTRDPISEARYHLDIRIRGGEKKVDALRADNPAKSSKKARLCQRRNQVIPIGRRLLERKSIGMAADDEEGRIAHPQASDQVVARPGSGACDEESSTYTCPPIRRSSHQWTCPDLVDTAPGQDHQGIRRAREG